MIRGDAGQSVVVVVLSMFVILAIAAFAIDAAEWFSQRHGAQVSADAAALAAANCMANAGVSGNACTSATDTTDAKSIANSYANANGPTIKTITVDTAARTVAVTTHTTGSLTFGGAIGMFAPNITSHAVASYGTVTLPSSIFAQDCASPVDTSQLTTALTSPCTVKCSQAGIGIDANNITITGALATNGSIDVKKNNGQGTDGDLLYGDPVPSDGSNDCVSSNINTGALSTQYGVNEETSFSYFPDTYYKALNAPGTDCASQSQLTTDGVSISGNTISLSGSIGTPSSPANIAICAALSTNWAYGYAIVVNAGASLYGVTLTGANISFSYPANGITVEGDAHYTPDSGGSSPTLAIFDTSPLQATMGSNSNSDTAGLILGAVNPTNGKLTAGNNFTISGAVWAPLGGIVLPGNNGATGALIEANTTVLSGNNAGGGTPVTVAATGTDQLTQ